MSQRLFIVYVRVSLFKLCISFYANISIIEGEEERREEKRGDEKIVGAPYED